MYISVLQLANRINNIERIQAEDITSNIVKIIVELSSNGREIDYFIDYKNGTREQYNEYNVPSVIVRIMNKAKPVYIEKCESGEKTFIYTFNH